MTDPMPGAPGPSPHREPSEEPRGEIIIGLSWLGTALYSAVAAVATAAPSVGDAALVATCGALFLAGAGAFLAAYAIAVGRSRSEAIGMGGLFFLVGSAPRRVRNLLMASLAVEVVVAVTSASIGLVVVPAGADNLLAFGLLTPLYGLGFAGLWGARHGVFGPRAAAGVAGGQEGAG